MTGTITTIQRMSVHDGPGLRSVVFMKGCNMRCRWCHNPETWSRTPQLQYVGEKCIGCLTCGTTHKCCIKDDVPAIMEKVLGADVVGRTGSVRRQGLEAQ